MEIVQNAAYASSEAQYDTLYAQLQRDAASEVVKYFNENWHPIKCEWVFGLKLTCDSFVNATNNRPKSIKGKLKQAARLLKDYLCYFDCFADQS